jgi:hypothetical protein
MSEVGEDYEGDDGRLDYDIATCLDDLRKLTNILNFFFIWTMRL